MKRDKKENVRVADAGFIPADDAEGSVVVGQVNKNQEGGLFRRTSTNTSSSNRYRSFHVLFPEIIELANDYLRCNMDILLSSLG